MKNKLRERERKRKRERGNFLCEKTMHRMKKKNCQIYSKMLRIRRVKIKEDKKVEKE